MVNIYIEGVIVDVITNAVIGIAGIGLGLFMTFKNGISLSSIIFLIIGVLYSTYVIVYKLSNRD